MPAISIICPVYKAEKYIHKCIDSVLAQTFTDFELQLIDDGSPDCSGRICDKYAEEDARVRVFHKENGGVASARQMGLDNAIGDYTIHVDPDDWVEANMLEELYAKAKETDADMVICDYWLEYSNRQERQNLNIINTNSQILIDELVNGRLHGSLWNKLIRRTFLVYNNIRFAEGLNICEDLTMCINVLSHGAKATYLNRAFYHYDRFTNPNALTSFNTRYGREQHDKWLSTFKNIISDKESQTYRTGVTYIAYWAFTHMIFSSKEYREFYKNEIKSFLFNNRNLRIKIVTILCALGLNTPLIYLYRAFKRY